MYGKNDLDLRDLLRNGSSDDEIKQAIVVAVANKPVDGIAAEQSRFSSISESMATIGG